MLDVDARQIVAANVKREMAARGWTQAELARRAKLYQPRISELISGGTDARLTTLEKVASAFGITVSALLMPPVPPPEPEILPVPSPIPA